MKLQQAIEAAYAAMHRVTDEAEMVHLRKELQGFRADCAYLEFIDQPRNSYPFKAESVHVMNHVKGKRESYEARRLQKSPGRETFVNNGVRIQQGIPLNMLDQGASRDTHFLNEIVRTLGMGTSDFIHLLILKTLLHVAEHEDKVVRCDESKLHDTVEEHADSYGVGTTILCNWLDASKLTPRRLREEGLGEFGTISPTRALAQGVMIVVASQPDQVGFVTVHAEPELFVGVEHTCDAVPTAVCHYGFAVWGNAPVTKIDFRAAQ